MDAWLAAVVQGVGARPAGFFEDVGQHGSPLGAYGVALVLLELE